MVAPSTKTPTPPTASLPTSALSGRGELVRFTVDDVRIMLSQGVLPEDSTTELLNGLVLRKDRSDQGEDPRVAGPKHRLAVRLLTKLAAQIDGPSRHVQIQSPIVCGEDQMPEPDFAVIRGSDDDYRERLPNATDTCCVIEVADPSLERDLTEKLPIYAAAGVPTYIVLDLRDSVAHHFTDPDRAAGIYRDSVVLQLVDVLAIPIGEGQTQNVVVAQVMKST